MNSNSVLGPSAGSCQGDENVIASLVPIIVLESFATQLREFHNHWSNLRNQLHQLQTSSDGPVGCPTSSCAR